MSSKTKENGILTGIDLGSFVEDALERASEEVLGKGTLIDLNEAYVVSVKPYKQVTDAISQTVKDAHEELYKLYVEKLNIVSAKIDACDASSLDGRLELAALKEDEACLSNSVMLHELYFANCFDPSSEIFQDMLSYIRLSADFGDFNRWQIDFQNVGNSGHGNGWLVCGYSLFHKRYLDTWISGHSSDVLVGLLPVLVVDCHEHAYFKDFGNDRKRYIKSLMAEINWNVVEERVKRIDAVARVYR